MIKACLSAKKNFEMFQKCSICKKPIVNEFNLKKLRILMLAGGVSGGLLGVAVLPLLGFGLSGIAAGSLAATWQASIGSVVAGSLFATLQSLGATGLGIVLFGATGSALAMLGTVAPSLNWCNLKH